MCGPRDCRWCVRKNCTVILYSGRTSALNWLLDLTRIDGGFPSQSRYFFQCSPVVQTFLQKLPCRVPWIFDLVDCPPHNIVHDILPYPNYYDPLYYAECYPELFATPSSVKLWSETSCFHISFCCLCSSMHHLWELNSLCSGEIPTIWSVHMLMVSLSNVQCRWRISSRKLTHIVDLSPSFVGHRSSLHRLAPQKVPCNKSSSI